MSDFRKRVLEPALIPIGAFVFIGVLVFGFSRLLLATTVEGAVILGTVMAGSILFAAGAIAKGGAIKKIQRLALLAGGASLVVGGVAVGAVQHTRPVEGHIEIADRIATASAGTTFAFDKAEIHLPPQKEAGILFTNKDSGIQHNIHIFTTPALTQSIFAGEVFPGPATKEYVVPPIAAGSYFFHCDVHSAQMKGTVIVGAGGPGPGPGPTASGPSPTPSSLPAGPLAVDMIDILKFDPPQLQVKAGDTVTWKNVGSLPHTVTADDQKTFDSGADPSTYVLGGGVFSFTFTKPGSYPYYCRLHGSPGGAGMAGTIVVG